MINQDSISVDDNRRFDYHVEVLRLFGKNFKAHMQATYKLDDGWRIWFPKLYKNRDFINILSDDGTLNMNQLPTSTIVSDKIFPKDEPGERIVFAHFIDTTTGKKYYKFVGVFAELIGNMDQASSRRIATIIYFDGSGRFSIKPLIG